MRASQVVLGSSFRPIRAGVLGVWASGDYLLSTIADGSFPRGGAPLLTNDRLGTTTALDPRCEVVGLGPPWILMRCPETSSANPYGPYDVELYSLAHGTRETVTPSPGLPQCSFACSDVETPESAPTAVGAVGIRWDASCYHCGHTYFFQNIKTGELRDDPTNATTVADLNSPLLARSTCPGVRLMRSTPAGYSGSRWGSLTLDGQFALVTGSENSVFLALSAWMWSVSLDRECV